MRNFPIMFVIVLGGDLVKSSEHLGVAYLAAILRKADYKVSITELKANDDDEYLIQALESNNIKLVGFTTTCINIKRISELTARIKNRLPQITVVYGGHMATFTENSMMNEIPDVDIIIRGEGEETILELVGRLESGQSIENVLGISYRTLQSSRVVKNADRPMIENLDVLPFPVRDQFEQNNKKLQYLRICSSRGCYGNCAYCSNFVGRNHKGYRWRGRSPKNVVDELEYLVKKYDFHTFDFVDSTFEDPPVGRGKERAARIAQEIIDRGLTIYYNCCFRAENWSENDHKLLDLLVKSGLEKINIGLEAGNDKGLEIFNKRARTRDNNRALEVIKKHPEIYITFGFIFYHPYQDFKDLRDNAQFLYGTGIGQVTRHYLWPLEVYPATLIKENLIRDGLLNEGKVVDDIYSYKFVNPEVATFTKHMTKFLSEDIIWDFEIFDIIIHTYIVRLLRKYREHDSICEIVRIFWNYVNKVREDISRNNFNFFINWLNAAENHWSESSVREAKAFNISEYLKEKKKEIQNEQLKLSKNLRKMGISLVNR